MSSHSYIWVSIILLAVSVHASFMDYLLLQDEVSSLLMQLICPHRNGYIFYINIFFSSCRWLPELGWPTYLLWQLKPTVEILHSKYVYWNVLLAAEKGQNIKNSLLTLYNYIESYYQQVDPERRCSSLFPPLRRRRKSQGEREGEGNPTPLPSA